MARITDLQTHGQANGRGSGHLMLRSTRELMNHIGAWPQQSAAKSRQGDKNMSSFSTAFSADHFRAESAREQEQLRNQTKQAPAKVLSVEQQKLFTSIARNGVPVAAARPLVNYLAALEARLEALEEAARNSTPGHLRSIEQR